MISRIRISAYLTVLIMLAASISYASDCPPPPRLTCEQLKERIQDRCPPEAPKLCPVCPECKTQTVTVPVEVVKEVPVPVEVIKEVTVTKTVPADPVGQWYLGGGPVWLNEWGAAAVAGYRFPRGVTLLAGPVWIPQYNQPGDSYSWYACRNGGGDRECTNYTTTILPREGGNEWGGQFLAIFPIGGKK